MLPFAKRGDDRSNNLVRLQQLFPRIVAADYEQPKRVSEDCRHLLKRMLTPDPNKRVTIPEIMQHPWYAPESSPSTHHRGSSCAICAPNMYVPSFSPEVVSRADVTWWVHQMKRKDSTA